MPYIRCSGGDRNRATDVEPVGAEHLPKPVYGGDVAAVARDLEQIHVRLNRRDLIVVWVLRPRPNSGGVARGELPQPPPFFVQPRGGVHVLLLADGREGGAGVVDDALVDEVDEMPVVELCPMPLPRGGERCALNRRREEQRQVSRHVEP